ncbi:MAG: hypothetical protein NVS2B5_09070 [Beijerinckiaceae bacterium]
MTYQNARHVRRRTRSTIDGVLGAGGEAYDRSRMLPRLLPVGPDDIAGAEPESTRRIVLMLARALRVEGDRRRVDRRTS